MSNETLITQLTKTNAELSDKIAGLNAEVLHLKLDKDESEYKIKGLKNDIIGWFSSHDNAVKEIEALEIENKQSNTEIVKIRLENKKLTECLKRQCHCEDLGYYGASGPCTVCKTLNEIDNSEVSDI